MSSLPKSGRVTGGSVASLKSGAPPRAVRAAARPTIRPHLRQRTTTNVTIYHWQDVVGASTFLAISVNEVGRVLHMAPATLSRRRGKDLNADESDRFYRLERIKELAVAVLEDADKASHWIQSEIPSLGGARPIDLIGTTKGYEDVVNVLNAIDYGVVV